MSKKRETKQQRKNRVAGKKGKDIELFKKNIIDYFNIIYKYKR